MASKLLRRTYGVDFKPMILVSDEVNAGVRQTAPDQILIYLNTGLLRECYQFLAKPIRSYYQRNLQNLTVDEELFTRTCLGACGQMAFWHEFAHAVRGHLAYKIASGQLSEAHMSETPGSVEAGEVSDGWIPWRVLEIDADIFGAQFLLAQLSAVHRGQPDIGVGTLARCYALGIRGLFQVLSGIDGVHDDSSGSTHPNPVSRAYAAFTHGMARASEMGMSAREQAEMLTVGQSALIDFEFADLGVRVDPVVLESFANSELKLWSARESELFKYQLKRSVA